MYDATPERVTRFAVPATNAAVAARFRRLAERLELEGRGEIERAAVASAKLPTTP